MSRTGSNDMLAGNSRKKVLAQSAPRNGKSGQKSVPLNDRAYEIIKHNIITCAYRPGQYVNENIVCTDLNLSRTPVHNAFNRLQLEGLVEMIPRKGIIIKPVSIDEIMGVAEARRINETACAAFASERATKSQLQKMEDILATSEAAGRERDVETLMLCDRDFHSTIAAATHNMTLAEVSRQLQERSLRVWFISLTNAEQLQKVQEEHRAILDAIRSGDPEASRASMDMHIRSFQANIARTI